MIVGCGYQDLQYSAAGWASGVGGEEATVEGLVAVVVAVVFLAGRAYALSAVNQPPCAEVADELASCGGGRCGSCSVPLPCVRERGHVGDHRCRNLHDWAGT
jgi:hypothetical protein